MGSRNSRPARAKISCRRHIKIPVEAPKHDQRDISRTISGLSLLVYAGIPIGGCYMMDLAAILGRDLKNTLHHIHLLHTLGWVKLTKIEGTKSRWVSRCSEQAHVPKKILPNLTNEILKVMIKETAVTTRLLSGFIVINTRWLRETLQRLARAGWIKHVDTVNSAKVYCITAKGRKAYGSTSVRHQ